MRAFLISILTLCAAGGSARGDLAFVESDPELGAGRFGHSLVALRDGRVLVAGGSGAAGYDSRCWIYDPDAGPSGAWSAAPSFPPSIAPWGTFIFGAAVLNDGRVLKVGGDVLGDLQNRLQFGDNGEGIESYILDLAEDKPRWARLPSRLPDSTFWSNAFFRPTVLADGRVLIFGGFSDDSGYSMARLTTGGTMASRRAFVFDPASEAWTRAGDLNVGRETSSGVLLPDGRVFVAGGHVQFTPGYYADGLATATAEIFDPGANAWTPAQVMPPDPIEDATVPAPLAGGRVRHVAAALGDGTVLVAGGHVYRQPGLPLSGLTRRSALIYDPATNDWRPTAPMSRGRATAAATVLPDGRVLVAGGFDERGLPLASSEIFDPATETWSAGPALPSRVTTPAGDVLSAFNPYHVSGSHTTLDDGTFVWGLGRNIGSAGFYDRLVLLRP
jgi:hypothetical protein